MAAGTVGAVVPVRGPAPEVRPEPAPPDLHGRDRELAATERLLVAERLVSVVGTGGVGKTRVAREIARRSPGAASVLLAPVTDRAGVVDALASALRLHTITGDVLTACLDVLAGSPRLVLLDNCEHLLDAVREVAAGVLEHCPEVRLLTTSREPARAG